MKFKFLIDLRNFNYDLNTHIQGPFFSRFLPDNEKDSIELKIKEGKIVFWFERRGYQTEDGRIIYDFNKKEIDNSLLPRQGIIEGGPLFGMLHIDDEMLDNPFQSKNKKSITISFAKKLVKIISIETQKILDILRYNFGQFWIVDKIHWDSRECSLGFFCKEKLYLKWYDEENNVWIDIVPNESSQQAILVSKLNTKDYYTEYITKENWFKFKELAAKGHIPSQGQRHLIKAYTTLDTGDYVKPLLMQ